MSTVSETKALQVVREKTKDECDEPLLMENKSRFVLFPIKHDALWAMYKKHVASFWTAEEVSGSIMLIYL